MVSGPINLTEAQTDTQGNSIPQGLVTSHDAAHDSTSQLLTTFDEPHIEEFDPISPNGNSAAGIRILQNSGLNQTTNTTHGHTFNLAGLGQSRTD